MKLNIIVLSTLGVILTAPGAIASDCFEYGCESDTPGFETLNHQIAELKIPEARAPRESMNIVSLKSVSLDNRPALWDGTNKKSEIKKFTKTVDSRDGVPIWDDSISSYKDTDFGDWWNSPLPTYFAGQVGPDEITIARDDIAVINAQIEELLIPMRPANNLWTSEQLLPESKSAIAEIKIAPIAIDNVKIIESDDACPFETGAECAIWRRKPMVRETVSVRSSKIRNVLMDEFILAANLDKNISADAPSAAPFLERYKMLMKSANACCTDGMVYSLRRAGATDGLIYKFMSDDANFYNIGSRCLMTTDSELDTKYPNTATANVIGDVRNGCLCRTRGLFDAMLSPFADIYKAMPEFAASKFNHTYTDGLGREITVSVNTDVQNVLKQLSACPQK